MHCTRPGRTYPRCGDALRYDAWLHHKHVVRRVAIAWMVWIVSAGSWGCGARGTADARDRSNADRAEAHGALQTEEQDAADVGTKDVEAPEDAQEPPIGTPSGTLRAQAWPNPADDARWRALEDGKGVFWDDQMLGARTFVFSSVEDSMPAIGLRIEFSKEIQKREMPIMLVLSSSPTPLHVTRDAYPSISSLLQPLGVVELDANPGDSVYIAFDDVERISLIQLQVWGEVSGEAERLGMGRVRLVHPDDPRHRHAARSYELAPVDAKVLPEDANVLGSSERITLPHQTRSRTQE